MTHATTSRGPARWVPAAVLATVVALLASCSAATSGTGAGGSGQQGGSGETDALTVYATTSYLADLAQAIDPDADVTTMVGPGGDPHTYQPSTRDIQDMRAADVVLWNGLHLEAQMTDQLESLGDAQVAVGEHVPDELLLDWPEAGESGEPFHDPHIWNSPEAWAHVIDQVAEAFADADPDAADRYRAAADAHADALGAAFDEAESLLATVPEPRILVTGHDAFGYLGEAFDLDVHATDFISTDAALSPRELSGLADLIADNEIPVIFNDNAANPQAISSLREAVAARGHQVRISDAELYSDHIGPYDHIHSLLHNARTIATELGDPDASPADPDTGDEA